jgi:hypothetical protein
VTLTAKDFEFKLTDTITLAGCPLGDDDYFAMFGHDWSDDDVVSTARTYLAEVGNHTDDEVNEVIDYATKVNGGVKRVKAGVLRYDDEWALTFTDGHAAPETVEVAYIRLQ